MRWGQWSRRPPPTEMQVVSREAVLPIYFGSTQGTSTVTFNGTAATVTSWSATSIATSGPIGATPGNEVGTVVEAPASHRDAGCVARGGPTDLLRVHAGDEHGHLQRNCSHGDELERDEHCDVRANWSDDGQCGGDSGRGGQQRGELHRKFGRRRWRSDLGN